MPNVMVIANNLQQASYRLRIDALRQPLAERGVMLDVRLRPRNPLVRRKLLKSAGEFDCVILQRKMLDALDMKLLRRSARRIFFDVDDAVMFHNRPVGAVARWRTMRRFAATAKNVDLVVAGNSYLAELFAARGPATTVLPTVVDPRRYRVKGHENTASPALVWIGSASTLPYLEAISPALKLAARRVPGLRMIVIADEQPAAPLPMQFVLWSSDSEAEALCQGDIGIAPTPTNRWTLGKCGFKIVQYMAAGLPVIASPVGANCEIIEGEKTGLLADSPREWAEAIARLAGDVNLRAQMGQAGRERVEREYSLDRAVNTWVKILNA